MKFFKNRFLFILVISIVTLGALVLGAMTLYEKEELIFSSDGYIIEATSKANTKYYFSANTQYKESVDEKIVFNDVDDKKVFVDPASFVHYSNGDVTFLKKGALVNLSELNASMINYYNITNQSTIKYDNGKYVVSSNDKKIDLDSFIGRISDSKYLISGKNLSLKIPQNNEKITGEYFEILFIEDGIIKIDNEKASYQVTAQDSYIYIGDDIVINLGNGKISYQDDVKMLLSQITISGDENIDLDVDEKDDTSAGGGGGGGSGDGTGEGDGDGKEDGSDTETGLEEGVGLGEGGSGEGDGTSEGTGDGEGTGEGDGTGEGGSGEGGSGEGGAGGQGEGVAVSASLQVELIEAIVTSTTIDLSLQLNNADVVEGKLLYYFTNLSTGKREGDSKYIDLVNGTFKVGQESLSPSTDYSFTIVETNSGKEKQYFQKTFRTKDLGVTLEKLYATSSTLAYKINFDENTDVTKARLSLCYEVVDKSGEVSCKDGYQFEVSKDEINREIVFEELKSNTTYAVSVDMVWIKNAAYSGVYNINRLDTTLKKTPVISGIKIAANSEEVRFDIKLNSVKDPDKSIEKYIYKIYLADDITVDNLDPVVQYSVEKNDSDDLVLNLNEIDELKTGVDYRCKIFAQYNDNEMVREVSTEYSSNFLIKSKPNVTFVQNKEATTMNKVEGTLKLIDANCTVPIPGRSCSNKKNKFTLRYYKMTEDEHKDNDTEITFNSSSLTSELVFENLSSKTTYAVKLMGTYYDDDGNEHENVQIGDTFFIKTDSSPNIYFDVAGDNKSGFVQPNGDVDIVTFDAKLTAPQSSNVANEISTMTFNLYSGRNNVADKLIGTYVITEKSKIEDWFTNQTITNSLFTDVTGKRLGNLNSLKKLIDVTNKNVTDNSVKTLNGSYTVELVDVYDSTGKNKIAVENNVYTFNLTASYYLDSRIEYNNLINNNKFDYVVVDPITKVDLSEEEYLELSNTVPELEYLNDDTIVGLSITNSLSDLFVNSAFEYEKVVVDYTIYNEVTKKDIKTISIDMMNKYQPKEQIVYLDSSELADGKTYFTRGYKYKIGFNLNFVTEDGSNPSYTNDDLYTIVSIDRQDPIYTQYIYNSNDDGITYRYNFNDIDKAVSNNNFYYTLGESKNYIEVSKSLIVDGNDHEATLPISENNDYTLYYARKNVEGKTSYIKMDNYVFEKEYKYDNSVSYSIVDDNSNILKLKLEDNIYTSRAYAYKVTIKADGVEDYTRYFLASKLKSLSDPMVIDDSEAIDSKYIGIDFSNIIDFMGHEMKIEVFCYYDSGLVGINQKFSHGMILKNSAKGKYLNTYYQGKDFSPISGEDDVAMGIYHLRDGFTVGDSNMFIYNHLVYKPSSSFDGSSSGIESEKNLNLDYYGINYNLDYTSEGIVFTNGKNKYKGYNFRVLNGVNLNTSNNKYLFETVIPSISVETNNTINSIKLNINPSGVYGNKQFIKNNQPHNKIYVKFYSDSDMTNLIGEKSGNVTITSVESGYTASVEQIVLNNLSPDTTYYYTVSAYINNEETRLFDTGIINSKKEYAYVDYDTNTLGVSGILSGITFKVNPIGYNGDYALNKLAWKLNLKNTENYRVRFELYRPDGTSLVVDPDTMEETEVVNYKAVNFDGTDASGCNINSYGSDTNAYINGCYINVKDASKINKKEFSYNFSNNVFVFGGNYYKMVVYAVPYTNNKYDEDSRLVLYENDKLSTSNFTSGGISYSITIPTLEIPTFHLNELNSGYDGNSYYISFKVNSTDNHKVVTNGNYYVTLKDADGNRIGERLVVPVDSANKTIKFDNLKSNTLYYIELNYDIYRNNVGYSDEEKTKSSPFLDFTYTPIDAGITLGTISARQLGTTSVVLSYVGSSNLVSNITKVRYTVSLKGGSGKVEKELTENVFTSGANDLPHLTIDVSGTGFTFKAGSTYIIETEYYYGDNKQLTDQVTGKNTFTTILSL